MTVSLNSKQRIIVLLVCEQRVVSIFVLTSIEPVIRGEQLLVSFMKTHRSVRTVKLDCVKSNLLLLQQRVSETRTCKGMLTV